MAKKKKSSALTTIGIYYRIGWEALTSQIKQNCCKSRAPSWGRLIV